MTRFFDASTGLVLIVVAAGLLGGVLLRASVESATTVVQRGDISAVVPEGWLVQPETDDQPLDVANPAIPSERFTLTAVATSQVPLLEAVFIDTPSQGTLLAGYRVLGEGPTVVGGSDAYAVQFIYLRAGGAPEIMRGDRYYFARGQHVYSASLYSPSERYQKALPGFERFLRSVVETAR